MNLERAISDAWADADDGRPEVTLRFFQDLLAQDPSDAVRRFELASAYDWMGQEAEAIPHYQAAIRAGLPRERDRRARIQLGSSLRNVGRADEAVVMLERVAREYPGDPSVECFLALALTTADRPKEAVSRLVDLIARTAGDDSTAIYLEALQRYARVL